MPKGGQYSRRLHSIVYVSSISCREFFIKSGGTKSANFLATESVKLSQISGPQNMVAIILDLQNKEFEFGQEKV